MGLKIAIGLQSKWVRQLNSTKLNSTPTFLQPKAFFGTFCLVIYISLSITIDKTRVLGVHFIVACSCGGRLVWTGSSVIGVQHRRVWKSSKFDFLDRLKQSSLIKDSNSDLIIDQGHDQWHDQTVIVRMNSFAAKNSEYYSGIQIWRKLGDRRSGILPANNLN